MGSQGASAFNGLRTNESMLIKLPSKWRSFSDKRPGLSAPTK
jgi:hypothetical protein